MRVIEFVNNPNLFPLLAATYGLSFTEYCKLPVDVVFNLYHNWQPAAGIRSGTEVFSVSAKAWAKLMNPDTPVGTITGIAMPPEFGRKLRILKEQTGKDKFELQEAIREIAKRGIQ
jgi:hypothetical protein